MTSPSLTHTTFSSFFNPSVSSLFVPPSLPSRLRPAGVSARVVPRAPLYIISALTEKSQQETSLRRCRPDLSADQIIPRVPAAHCLTPLDRLRGVSVCRSSLQSSPSVTSPCRSQTFKPSAAPPHLPTSDQAPGPVGSPLCCSSRVDPFPSLHRCSDPWITPQSRITMTNRTSEMELLQLQLSSASLYSAYCCQVLLL